MAVKANRKISTIIDTAKLFNSKMFKMIQMKTNKSKKEAYQAREYSRVLKDHSDCRITLGNIYIIIIKLDLKTGLLG